MGVVPAGTAATAVPATTSTAVPATTSTAVPASTGRPYVLLSCATSIDGYIDDATGERLLLSNAEDMERIDAVRAGCDAILVGAGTIRADDPRLVVRSARLRAARQAAGLPPSPVKVTMTARGLLDPQARFFTVGDAEKVVYCAGPAVDRTTGLLSGLATVVDAGDPLDPARVLADLAGRGVQRLMVEGGASVHAQFLTAGLADELHLVVAPFFVGDRRAPRFVGDGAFPWHPGRRARLAEVRQIGDVVLMRYALSERCADGAPG
ncbi:RibD family protein [Micromonospora sp. WMMD708]|uniref:RibD family protein n=1 Tax=Micromonospora sp. WMMD708 TaxID=3403464 RepID=UPI003BF4D91A